MSDLDAILRQDGSTFPGRAQNAADSFYSRDTIYQAAEAERNARAKKDAYDANRPEPKEESGAKLWLARQAGARFARLYLELSITGGALQPLVDLEQRWAKGGAADDWHSDVKKTARAIFRNAHIRGDGQTPCRADLVPFRCLSDSERSIRRVLADAKRDEERLSSGGDAAADTDTSSSEASEAGASLLKQLSDYRALWGDLLAHLKRRVRPGLASPGEEIGAMLEGLNALTDGYIARAAGLPATKAEALAAEDAETRAQPSLNRRAVGEQFALSVVAHLEGWTEPTS